jgi:16S rRNA (guanine1516-N2)-methyltransferase
MKMSNLPIYLTTDHHKGILDTLLDTFTLDVIVQKPLSNYLALESNGVSYYDSTGQVIRFSWDEEWRYHRRQSYSLRRELLARALGLKGNQKKSIWDLTCGTGKDSLLMLAYGQRVTAFERIPEVAALLISAIHSVEEESLNQVIHNNFEFHLGSGHRHTGELPQVLYYDPMYVPRRRKAALPRKEMQIFKNLVGGDGDQEQILKWALSTKVPRVIVKRPPKSPPIIPSPTAQFIGKTVRYDLYC